MRPSVYKILPDKFPNMMARCNFSREIDNCCRARLLHYRPPTKLWEGNVFTCLSFCWGPHVTITHDALDFTVQAPGTAFLLVICGGNHWRPVQTCSCETPSPLRSDIWWPLKHVQFLVDVHFVRPASKQPESTTWRLLLFDSFWRVWILNYPHGKFCFGFDNLRQGDEIV